MIYFLPEMKTHKKRPFYIKFVYIEVLFFVYNAVFYIVADPFFLESIILTVRKVEKTNGGN